jgi:glyoxalase family protein
MNAQLHTEGIHHITAVASSANDNLTFYRKVMGLQLVKKTVNFDDPYTYHFYYADPAGTPGTILTFFPWENIPHGKTGAGMITTVSFCIPAASLNYWAERLAAHRIHTKKNERFGELLLKFSDPHGLELELIGSGTESMTERPEKSPVPARHAIVGFHSATAMVHPSSDPHDLLVDGLGLALQHREGNRSRYRSHGEQGQGRIFDVVLDGTADSGRPGAGTVHHIAFRAPDKQVQRLWRQHLQNMGYPVTPVRDRNYFRSIYFTTPGGVLFEIATDPPGFAVDEPMGQLGRSLKLPAVYEPMRSQIESRLPSLADPALGHASIHPEPVN